MDATWFINAGLLLGHCVVTVNVFLNGHCYPINGNSLTGPDKQVVRHKAKSKENYIYKVAF